MTTFVYFQDTLSSSKELPLGNEPPCLNLSRFFLNWGKRDLFFSSDIVLFLLARRLTRWEEWRDRVFGRVYILFPKFAESC